MLILPLTGKTNIKTYRELNHALEMMPGSICFHHDVLSSQATNSQIIKFFPNMNLSVISKEDDGGGDTFDRIADKIENFVVWIFKSIYKLSVAIWKKLLVLFDKLRKFVGFCLKRSDNVKQRLELTIVEGRKLIMALKRKCDDMIKTGFVSDPNLVQYVEMVKESTGVKTSPIDPESAVSVRQWLESLNSVRSFKFIKGLEYTIPDMYWNYFGYNNKLQMLTPEYNNFHMELNNYYFKFAENLKGLLSGDRLQHVMVEKLANKKNLNKDNIISEITEALIDKIYTLEAPTLEGNISEAYRIDLPKRTMRDLYNSSKDKLLGFEAAIVSYLCTVSQANNKEFIAKYDIITNLPDMANFATGCKKALQTLYVNGEHLFGKDRKFKDTTILSQQQAIKLVNEIVDPSSNNIQEIVNAVMSIIRVCDKILSQVHTYWEQLTSYQTKSLNNMQNYVVEFLPKLQ